MKRCLTFALSLSLLLAVSAGKAEAIIVLLKGQDAPVRGYFVRENEHVVVLQQLQSDGSTQERTLSRSEIEEIIRSVDSDRLATLTPSNPDAYREYAEELAEKSKDPDAQVTAIRLFLIAASLQPQRLGRSCLLGMVPLARHEAEQKRFRAMAYLLDPTHDTALLAMPAVTRTPKSDLEPRQVEFLLRALRLLRQGKQRDALAQARRVKLKERLHELTDTITYKEFERACEPTCPYCQRGREPCPDCKGAKFVESKACARCSATGDIPCHACGGDYRNNRLPPSLFRRIIQLELEWLPADETAAPPPDTTRASWSKSVQEAQLQPLAPLTLETLTEFDPRANTYREGQWKP